MIGKSTSFGNLQDIVSEVDFPGLTQTDRLIMRELARCAGNWHTGENSYPGVDRLSRRAGVDRRTIQRRLRWLEKAGLIECTTPGHGHSASIYRICLDHIGYRSGKEERQRGAAINENESEEGRHSSKREAAIATERGGIQAKEGRHNSAALTNPQPTLNQPPTNPTQAVQKTNGPPKGWEGWLSSKTAIMGVPTKKERHELEKLVGDHGLPVVQEVARQFENRDKGLAGLKHPWLMLLQEAPMLIPAAKEAVWKASPEYKAREEQFYIQASILLGNFYPLPPVNWPHMTEEELALLQKAKAGDPQRLFLSREELNDLHAIKNRYSDWQREQEKREQEMSPLDLLEMN